MKYRAYRTIESKVCAGVSFTLCCMTKWRRDELREMQREARAKIQPHVDEGEPLWQEYRTAVAKRKEAGEGAVLEFDDAKYARMVELDALVKRGYERDVLPIALSYVVTKVDGLEMEEEPGETADPTSIEDVLINGPDPLLAEIVAAVEHEVGLSEQERANLYWPSTLAAAVDGTATAGNADRAERPHTTIVAAA